MSRAGLITKLKTAFNDLSGKTADAKATQIGGDIFDEVSGLPIGSIIDWHKNLPGTPALPGNWAELNGQTISDSDSPYNGVTLPDWNGEGRFLRGGSTSGIEQDNQLLDHKHDVGWGSSSAGGYGNSANTYQYRYNETVGTWTMPYTSSPLDVDTGNENRPINASVVYIIRIK